MCNEIFSVYIRIRFIKYFCKDLHSNYIIRKLKKKKILHILLYNIILILFWASNQKCPSKCSTIGRFTLAFLKLIKPTFSILDNHFSKHWYLILCLILCCIKIWLFSSPFKTSKKKNFWGLLKHEKRTK